MDFVIESATDVGSVPTGMGRVKGCPVLDPGSYPIRSRLKFVSTTLNFDIKQAGNTVVVKADAIQFPPAPNPSPVVPDMELIRENGTITLRTTPNSVVRITRRDGEQWTLETDEFGDVRLTQLPRGVYTITIGNSGPIRAVVAGSRGFQSRLPIRRP